MAMSLENIVKQLEDSGIVAAGKLENFVPPKAHPTSVEELVAELVKNNHLTRFQAAQVAAGKAKSLILGEYTILDKIGAGGMGQVFKAEHRRMKRAVAIKMLPAATMKEAGAVARFQREVEAAAKLRHPNIVAADDAGQSGAIHFLVMEYVEGQDLSALVKKNGPFPVAKATNFILQAARGLEFAHGEGVVHRDIKPGNLLLDKKGTVKILDMGLARIEAHGADVATQAELTGSGTIMGTVDYMAPEQAMNTKTADARADIYSLGCTLYYLVTGKATYEGETVAAKLIAHHNHPIPEIRKLQVDVPEGVEAIFKRMVAKKIEDRYQSMSEVIADLERLGAGQSLSVGTLPTFGSNVQIQITPTIQKTQATTKVAAVTPSNDTQPPKKNTKLLIGAAFLGVLILSGIIVSLKTKDGTLVVEVDQPDAMVQVLNVEGKVEVSQKGGVDKVTISIDSGKHRLRVEKEGFVVYGTEFEIEKGGTKAIAAKLVPMKNAAVAADPDRRAAEWIIKTGGSATLIGDGKWTVIRSLHELPSGNFKVHNLRLGDREQIKDEELAILTHLTELVLVDFSPGPGISSGLTNGCIPYLNKLSNLRNLRLDRSHIDDYGLSELSASPQLASLGLRGTKVTSAGVATLQKALPKCKIEWDDPTNKLKTPTSTASLGPSPPLAVAPFNATEAKAHQTAWAKHLGIEVEMPNSVGMKMVLIPPGEFMMGSTDEQVEQALKAADGIKADQQTKDRIQKAERPQHKVVITKPFSMSSTEVTVGQFKKFSATGYLTKAEKNAQDDPTVRTYLSGESDDLPAASITWDEAVAYCQWLSNQEKRTYRLPTEAEWEYACRAGTTTQYSFGDDYNELPKYGWFVKNSGLKSHPVGMLLPNPFGLFDMHGNLFEWCGDYFDEKWYEKSPTSDPKGPVAYSSNILRGGNWTYHASRTRSAYRINDSHTTSLSFYGFRCVSELEAPAVTASIPNSSQLFLHDPAFPQWMAQVQAMPAEEQIKAVSKKLVELNPGFDGKATNLEGSSPPKIENGAVVEYNVLTYEISDISPLRAFTKLRVLSCGGTQQRLSKLADLSPLQGMELDRLHCSYTQVTNLSPLRGMPLTSLRILFVPAADISPLFDLPLKFIACSYGPNLHDLQALTRITTLQEIEVFNSRAIPADQVAALQQSMPNCKVKWVAVTLTNPTTKLFLHDPAFPLWMKDVQAMPAQEQINAVSKKLVELNPGFDGVVGGRGGISKPAILNGIVRDIGFTSNNVTDISPVRALAGLRVLNCVVKGNGDSKMSDLSPLQGMGLISFSCERSRINDLSPLKGMLLVDLLCSNTLVADLSPLHDMRLNRLHCANTRVNDLSPLEGMQTLSNLLIGKTKVTAAQVAALQKALPDCKIDWDDPAKSTTPAAPKTKSP